MDVVVTVPKGRWEAWLAEGDLPGDEWSGEEWDFYLAGGLPRIEIGERVYVVAHGKLRGYAPLVRLVTYENVFSERRWSLLRRGGAVAVTLWCEDHPCSIRGFPGWRYRWWDRTAERPFPDWRTP